ncbi:unnamed protein product [Ophioblennius macclurei]
MVMIGDTISSSTSNYRVKQVLGSGGFGMVTLCRKKPSDNMVALKIVKGGKSTTAPTNEAMYLDMMRCMGSEMFNIVQCMDSFRIDDVCYIELEKLDISLSEYIDNHSMTLQEIRPIVQQLAEAVCFLKAVGVVHADLKPGNVMFVNHILQPYRVKLIDFSEAHDDPERCTGNTCGTLWYKSPEMLLGAPYSHPIDTWGLGLIAAEMRLEHPVLPGRDEFHMLMLILQTMGQIPDSVLDSGFHTTEYFEKRTWMDQETWVLKSEEETQWDPDNPIKALMDLMRLSEEVQPQEIPTGRHDLECFVDLIVKLIDANPHDRIAPSDVLSHPFLTLGHLDGSEGS